MPEIKPYYLWLITLLLAIGLLISLITRPPSITETVKDYTLKNKIDSLNQVIKQYPKEREFYEHNIDSLSKSIEKKDKQLSQNEKELSEIQKKFKDQQDRIDNFSSSDIIMFFNSRYGTK